MLADTIFAFRRAASALGLAAAVVVIVVAASAQSGCGKGPVAADHTPTPTTDTITFEIFLQGPVIPSGFTQPQGDYFIAINCNVDASTNVNGAFGEVPNEPYSAEAQNGTYTHWDQEFIYGFDTASQPNGFLYAYKVISGVSGGGTTVNFLPILLNANDFRFIPNGSANGLTGNAIMITLPLADLSIRANPSGSGTIVSPPVTQIFVNYMTTGTDRRPTDALGCCGTNSTSYVLNIPLGVAGTYVAQLTTPPDKQGGPSNPALYITGGEIIVSLTGP